MSKETSVDDDFKDLEDIMSELDLEPKTSGEEQTQAEGAAAEPVPVPVPVPVPATADGGGAVAAEVPPGDDMMELELGVGTSREAAEPLPPTPQPSAAAAAAAAAVAQSEVDVVQAKSDVKPPAPAAVSEPVPVTASSPMQKRPGPKAEVSRESLPEADEDTDDFVVVQGVTGQGNRNADGGGAALPDSVGEFARELGFGAEAESVGSMLGNFWNQAKSTASTARSKVTNMVHEVSEQALVAGDQLLTTGEKAFNNAGSAARNLNTKILIRPEASFGVPIEAILKRECGDDCAERVPSLVENLLSVLEARAKSAGPLPALLFTRVPADAERDSLFALRDHLDTGGPLTAIPPETAVLLLKQFLLELPTPLLTYGLYNDFVEHAVSGEGAVEKCSDVADKLPPPYRATARRILKCLNDVVEASAADSLGLVLGPCLLRSREKEVRTLMLDLPAVAKATRLFLDGADRIFVPTCWFLAPWMGVYAIKCVEGPGSRAEQELVIDADGMLWGEIRSRAGSEVDASTWPRHADNDEGVMIAAAKFEGKTLVLTFKGGNASAGLAEVEEVIIEAVDGELQERITRRFVGNFVRALPWQDSLQKWADLNVGGAFDEGVHPDKLQKLWRLVFLGTGAEPPPPRKDERWGELGFQQKDPATDFRGGGMVALDLLLHLAEEHGDDTRAYLSRSKGATAMEGYPFACGCINVCFTLMEVLQLFKAGGGKGGGKYSMKESGSCRRIVGTLMMSDPLAFQSLFVAAVAVLDQEWASSSRMYMKFNEVLGRVRARVCAAIRSHGASSVADICSLMVRRK